MEYPFRRKPVIPLAERCASPRGKIPPGQPLLEQMGILGPTAARTPSSTPRHVAYPGWIADSSGLLRCASLSDRCVAAVLDALVLLAPAALAAGWASSTWGFDDGSAFNIRAASLVMAALLAALSCFLYYWLLEAAFGATLGKVLAGIRVANDGHRHALWAAAIRNALRVLDGVGFYLVGALVASCTKARQRLGDIAAGTFVAQHDFSLAARISAVMLWFAVLIVTVWAFPQVLAAGPGRVAPPRYLPQTVIQLGTTSDSAYLRTAYFTVAFRLGDDRTQPVRAPEAADPDERNTGPRQPGEGN